MNGDLLKTPLYDWHVAHDGRMVDFAGWSMPVQYSSIKEEHLATRSGAALFDVSHMGRFRFEGPEVVQFLDRVLTRRMDNLANGRIRYSLCTNAEGGVLDDLLVYNMTEFRGEPYYGMVVNASNRKKLLDWFQSQIGSANVRLTDETLESSMIAVQGPQAVELVQSLGDIDVASMKYYSATIAELHGVRTMVSRTGYTGEDGVEIVVQAENSASIWNRLATDLNCRAFPAGLGARDTLRLEAGMPLYGHELSESLVPVNIGLDFALDLEDRQFIGRDAIAAAQNDPSKKHLVGLKLEGKRVPREGFRILDGEEQEVGWISSGTFSPTLNCPIAMGFVSRDSKELDTRLFVDIRNRSEAAVVVPLPFYRRAKKG